MIIPNDICKSIKRMIGINFNEYQINSMIDIELYEVEDIMGIQGKSEIINSITINDKLQYEDFMDFYNLLLITDMGKAERQIIKHNIYAYMIYVYIRDCKKETLHKIIYNVSKKERTCDE